MYVLSSDWWISGFTPKHAQTVVSMKTHIVNANDKTMSMCKYKKRMLPMQKLGKI